MRQQYPPIKPFQRHTLKVDDVHTLYIDESGNPNGHPVLFLHGGPGAGCGPSDRCFFDPAVYRIIIFDQRGAGRSTPHANISSNTTHDLINDIEAIRILLNIETWALFGGSWGATLALLYAQAYPAHVNYLMLRGVFLCRDKDINWLYKEGANAIFPDYWQDFIHPVAKAQPGSIVKQYHTLLMGENELAKMGAAKAWSLWEARCATLRPNANVVDRLMGPHLAQAMAIIETHYFLHNGFIEPNQILDNIDKIKDIPCSIVHGRYDMVCPLENAHTLVNAFNNAQLHIIRDAGHSSAEPGIIDALIRVTDDAAKILSGDSTDKVT